MQNWQLFLMGAGLVVVVVFAQACGWINLKPIDTKEEIATNIYAGILLADVSKTDVNVSDQAVIVLNKLELLVYRLLHNSQNANMVDLIELAGEGLPKEVDPKLYKAVQALLIVYLPRIEPAAKLKTHLNNLQDVHLILKAVLSKLRG